ncbi:MAG: hypothetical protein LBI85_04480 [Spirochaetaceae bacterium]|jgi:hypothetical protein|nr:hypothetical protein [Spirochaetaceae bacterium]
MCWYCGSPVTDGEPLGRSLRCGTCGRDLRSCRHCRSVIENASSCRESQAEVPRDRDRGNFCDWFVLDSRFRSPSKGSSTAIMAEQDARNTFDSLFK